jgi:hypothetical protein
MSRLWSGGKSWVGATALRRVVVTNGRTGVPEVGGPWRRRFREDRGWHRDGIYVVRARCSHEKHESGERRDAILVRCGLSRGEVDDACAFDVGEYREASLARWMHSRRTYYYSRATHSSKCILGRADESMLG